MSEEKVGLLRDSRGFHGIPSSEVSSVILLALAVDFDFTVEKNWYTCGGGAVFTMINAWQGQSIESQF